MSLLNTPQTGRWRDHSDGHRLQTLQDDSWLQAQWFKVAIAISLTLTTPCVLKIILSTCWGLKLYLFPAKTPKHRDHESARGIVSPDIMGTATGGKEGLKYWVSGVFAQNSHWEARHRFFWSFALALLFVVFYAQIIVAIRLTDLVASSRFALLESEVCGLYEYDNEKAGEEDAVRADMLMVGRERRAAAYAQDCYDYDTKTNVKATNCDFFYNSTIGYQVSEDKCPFDRTDVCVDGYQPGSAITFDTDWVDSGILGINEESMHKFRRKTTCAPLSADRPFVQHFTNSATSESGYKYFYGSLYDTRNCSDEVHAPPPVLSEYTMRMTGHPFDWQAPVYKVNTYATSLLDPTCDFYQPSAYLQAPGLLPDRTKTLSLILVTALRILYTKRSNDPVFPADKAFQYPGDKGYYYYNSQPKARAFACIDETIFCAPSGSPCWHANDPVPAEGSDTSSYWLMKYALKSSNTYDSIKLRLGSGLLAQQRVGQSRSMPLADNHWQLEAEHLFKTSLARAQFDAWSIASAEDHDNPTYTDTLPDEARGRVCGLFKFRASDYINIRILPFVWLMLAWPIMLLSSVELNTYKRSWHIFGPWVDCLKRSPVKGTSDATATTATIANSSSDGDATAVAASSNNHPINGVTASNRDSVSSNQPQADFTSKPDTPHTEPTASAMGSVTSAAPQPPDASASNPSDRTPLIASSSTGTSSHENPNYGTTSGPSNAHAGHDSAQVDRQQWSPLLIHFMFPLGAWIVEKLRNRKNNGRVGGETV